MNFDFLIKGGMVFDGSRIDADSRRADIGIKDGIIKALGGLSGVSADKVIEAENLCVCPGFIDAHAHSDFTLLADGRAEGKVCQGITTEINGNCGMSAAPLYGEALEQRAADLKQLDIRERWNSFSEYFALLGQKGFAVNFLTLVGHGNLRASVAGYSDKQLAPGDINKILSLLSEALDSGAAGLSTGLVYPPGIYADTREIIKLARRTAEHGGIYTTHMRSEGDRLLEAVDEAIKIGFDSGIPVHISHLKTSGNQNWRKITDVFGRIFNAREAGLKLTCDRYPYTASSTGLDAVLPAWAYEGGHEKEFHRLKSSNVQERIRKEILQDHPDKNYWDNIRISTVNTAKNKWTEGKSLSEISMISGKAPASCLFDILIAEDLNVDALFFSMSEGNLRSILKLPYAVIGSDSSARSFDGNTAAGKPHPRGFGCFPRVLGRYVRKHGIITLKEAIYKMTGLPAGIFGINRRGVISEGGFADIAIFDSNTVIDKASYDNPFQRPDGIYYVFVNGVPVLWEGRPTGARPGRILR